VERSRESFSRIVVAIGLFAAALAVVVLGTGGFATTILGWRISVHDPRRAAGVAAASFLVAIAVAGRGRALAIANAYIATWARVLRPVQTVAAAVARVFDRHAIVIACATLAGLAALALKAAHDKPFWHDEVFTILVSQLPFGTTYRAATAALDLAPPLNTALTRLAHGVGGVGVVVTRLTPIVSFLASSALLFAIVKRRAGTLAALTAALLPAAMASWPYAYEARGYALSMACFAAALHGWFEAAAGRRVRLHLAMMAVALAAGLWTHYYFVLAFVPIVLGEIVRQIAQRRIDPRPWLAIAAAGVIALPLWPLVLVSSAQRATFWARPDADSPLATRIDALYGSFFSTPEQRWLVIFARIVVALVIVEVLCRALWRVWPKRLAGHELMALAACALLPVAGVLVGDALGVFTGRYVLFTIVGVVLAIVLGLWWLAPPSGLAEIVAVIGMIAVSLHLGSRIVSDRERLVNELERHPILADRLLRAQDPIVITGSVDYLAIWYYTPASARSRALCLDDPGGELRDMHSDSVSRGYSALARWTPLPVVPIDEFVAAHRRFWMYSFGPDWIERSLTRRGATLIEHARDRHDAGTLYEVRMNP
jgi:Dolichyl-phosphate-mannose-protein mannosyltransferase